MLKNLIPKIFYDHLQDGLAFFVDGLGFEVKYQDEDMAVIERDGADDGLRHLPRVAKGLTRPSHPPFVPCQAHFVPYRLTSQARAPNV
jgi:hypothetical protein